MRPSWHAYFMGLARMVSTRSTCDRAHVGAVIVRERQVLSTGYNGSPAGAAHCDDAGHEMVDGHCVRTIHAEMNALVQAAKNGVPVGGSEIYVTHFPCYVCFKMVVNAGIKTIYYGQSYRKDEKVVALSLKLGVRLLEANTELGVSGGQAHGSH